jgi:hypothetical protein
MKHSSTAEPLLVTNAANHSRNSAPGRSRMHPVGRPSGFGASGMTRFFSNGPNRYGPLRHNGRGILRNPSGSLF